MAWQQDSGLWDDRLSRGRRWGFSLLRSFRSCHHLRLTSLSRQTRGAWPARIWELRASRFFNTSPLPRSPFLQSPGEDNCRRTWSIYEVACLIWLWPTHWTSKASSNYSSTVRQKPWLLWAKAWFLETADLVFPYAVPCLVVGGFNMWRISKNICSGCQRHNEWWCTILSRRARKEVFHCQVQPEVGKCVLPSGAVQSIAGLGLMLRPPAVMCRQVPEGFCSAWQWEAGGQRSQAMSPGFPLLVWKQASYQDKSSQGLLKCRHEEGAF